MLRTKLSDLPQGKALELYERRWQNLFWVTFQFEPLYGYVGRYRLGEAFVSEGPAGGNLVFRTYALGTPLRLLGVTLDLAARGRPGAMGAAVGVCVGG